MIRTLLFVPQAAADAPRCLGVASYTVNVASAMVQGRLGVLMKGDKPVFVSAAAEHTVNMAGKWWLVECESAAEGLKAIKCHSSICQRPLPYFDCGHRTPCDHGNVFAFGRCK